MNAGVSTADRSLGKIPGQHSDKRSRELPLKILLVFACCLWIQLSFFKYLPDIGTAVYQKSPSVLTDFEIFQNVYMAKASVHAARFLGNHIVFDFAKMLAPYIHSSDIRFHPLRIAAAILTSLYFIIGVAPIFFVAKEIMNWRVFLAGYAVLFACGMYIFYPCDAPSLAVFSFGFFYLLRGWLVAVLICLVVMGLFRESAFHLLVVTAMWALTCGQGTAWRRAIWLMVMALIFVLEYKITRIYFPGPLTGTGGLILGSEIFTGKGLLSFTSMTTLSLVALGPAVYLCLRVADWRNTALDRFFLLNCLAVPCWVIFYRMFGGNITEFRMLWPALLPLVYGIAMAGIGRENQTI